MSSLKRCSTVAPSGGGPDPQRIKIPRLLRTSAMVSPPLAHRVGALQPFIVVVKHCYPLESASNSFGQARGLGNSFTMEVVAADDQDAIDTVEAMFQMDFGESNTLNIVSVLPAPGVDYRNGHGRTVSVLSSRHCAVKDGYGPYEELFNAVRDDKTIAAREGEVHPMTEMETQVGQAMTGAMSTAVATMAVAASAITPAAGL